MQREEPYDLMAVMADIALIRECLFIEVMAMLIFIYSFYYWVCRGYGVPEGVAD